MIDFFTKELADLDPSVANLIDYEAERQARKLVLIPSESQAPAAVREALGSVFQNIYAEGYPDPGFHGEPESVIMNYEMQLGGYRRYSDLRYYKGVEYVNILELLARRRAAEAFANEQVSPEDIWVNVQPLSGSPANNAIFAALVPIGSTVMGMDLMHGGHLTHGSPVNRSGKLYNIVSYGINLETEKLDYDQIQEMAFQHRPKMIIAGYTSYPWMPDWARFRKIADSVGAYLLADISHISGMVAAGVVASPIGYADVTSFTTHKTLYGPRGAAILTTDKKLAAKIDMAVFPGEQGGPHVNAIAGMAVAFKLARSADFIQLQKQVVENAANLAKELALQGLHIPYGGTDTHMLLIDCKSIRAESGISPDDRRGTPLMGDVAARILDLAGIVLNRNTIPGDRGARNPSGVRLGTPWVTQRGFKTPEIRQMAKIIASLMKAMRPYAFAGRFGPIYRAKVDFEVLEKAKWDVVELACCVDLPSDYSPSGYPHHFFMYKPTKDKNGDWDIIEIEGPHARGFCNVAMTNDVYALAPGDDQPTWILEPDGKLMSSGLLKRPGQESTRFRLLVPKDRESRVAHWLRALSDGFVNIDKEDIYVKNTGPVAVRRLPQQLVNDWQKRPPMFQMFDNEDVGWAFHKPYWIGQRDRANAPGGLSSLPVFSWTQPENATIRQTVLNEVHRQASARLVPFAGWEMPVRYSSVQQEHLAVRNEAGLFDISHMGLFEFSGDNVHLFLNVITTNDISLLKPGNSHYSYLLDPDGKVIDDIWVYQLDDQRYWMVVNAANVDKDWEWVNAVREARVLIDNERPWSRALGTEHIKIRNLREEQIQLALQGPKSTEILLSLLAQDAAMIETIEEMKRTEIIHGEIAGYEIYLARTGYTGEPQSYEIFINPMEAPGFWHTLMEAGIPFGLHSIGLGARDSLRIEAGFPLYGHELAGPLDLDPGDGGFSPYVKLYKPFFVGKAAFVEQELNRKAKLIRFRIDEERARLPEQGDVIVNRKGRVVGAVTSCSIDSNGRLTGLGYVRIPYNKIGERLAVFQSSSRDWTSKPLSNLKNGDRVQMHDDITVIKRFLNKTD